MKDITKIFGLAVASMSLFCNAALADAISVPEPSSMSLYIVGGIGLLLVARVLKSIKPLAKVV
jgi:hypothetical protein